MKIIDWKDFIQGNHVIGAPCGVTVGVFDGFHHGHRYLVNRLFVRDCEEKVVFTFRDNPAWFFNKNNFHGDIYTLSQKLEAIKMAGVTTTVLIDFSSDFSKLTGNYFISCILSHLNVVKMAVGEDFKCGRGNDTSATDIASMLSGKAELEIVKRQPFRGHAVSSSLIRVLIKQGRIDQAEELMEFGYTLNLENVTIYHENDYCYIYRNDTRQVLPDEGRHFLSILSGSKAFRREVFIDNIFLKWLKTSEC